MKRPVILVLMLLGTALAYGEDKQEGGYWWNRQSESFKLVFVEGYTTAMARAGDLAVLQCTDKVKPQQKGLPPQYPGDQIIKSCLKDSCIPDFSQMTIGQVADDVDEFYKDFRNKLVGIHDALDYVRDELKGTSPDELERKLKLLRTASAPK